ncbi:uncharacterized protein LOC135844147 [Planococcus citri]|uniref:uncharacterized protein LOC135844147 n=1 Tax=Planococcus citri TaxID=170843 RepID=UPI0031FA0CDC
MINFVVFGCFVSMGCVYSEDAWTLQRASGDESSVIFENTTFTGDLMMCSWSWRDSLAGIWESRVKVSFKNDKYLGGGFDYHDGYGRELIRVRWYQLKDQNVTWKTLLTNKFPPTAWNLSASFASWGYMPMGDNSWGFFVNNVTVEPKPIFQRSKLVPFVASIQDLAMVLRKKRSAQSQNAEIFERSSNEVKGFNVIDLFTGNGIFSQVPQMVINVYSFISSLFPADSNDYDLPPDDYSTEPEAETVPTTTASVALKTTPAL